MLQIAVPRNVQHPYERRASRRGKALMSTQTAWKPKTREETLRFAGDDGSKNWACNNNNCQLWFPDVQRTTATRLLIWHHRRSLRSSPWRLFSLKHSSLLPSPMHQPHSLSFPLLSHNFSQWTPHFPLPWIHAKASLLFALFLIFYFSFSRSTFYQKWDRGNTKNFQECNQTYSRNINGLFLVLYRFRWIVLCNGIWKRK